LPFVKARKEIIWSKCKPKLKNVEKNKY